jgi:hypothetical protein
VASNCLITANSAVTAGGAYVQSTVITHCTITNNAAASAGGLRLQVDSQVRNCLVAGNDATNSGGGILVNGTGSRIESSTIAGNTAGTSGGGVYFNELAALTNCIIRGNSPEDLLARAGIGSPWASFSCLGDLTPPLNHLPVNGGNNTTNSPAFVDAGGGDFRLEGNSPCVDAGTNQNWMATSTDLDGNARILHRTVDIGAYEWVPPPSGAVLVVQ